jgi:hypothetical protein
MIPGSEHARVKDMKGRKVALLGLAALGVASICHAKVVVLDTAPNSEAAVTPRVFAPQFLRQGNYRGNYVQSAYLERPYGILSAPAATNANYEPAAAPGGMKSFRELTDDRTPEQSSGSSTRGSFESTVSGEDGATGITDACVTLLTICGLAAFQLSRKQQLLKHLPLSH